jgi:hypothetical protein
MTVTCTWQSSPGPDEQLEAFTPTACGQPARAVYWRRNPKRKQPDQPQDLTYPACPTHDTPARQRAAADQGYNREVL